MRRRFPVWGLLILSCAPQRAQSPASPPVPTTATQPAPQAATGLKPIGLGPIRLQAEPIPVSEDPVGLASPQAIAPLFCRALEGDYEEFIHRAYAPVLLADEHLRCRSQIFACGPDLVKDNRARLSCSAGEHARKSRPLLLKRFRDKGPEGVSLLSCRLKKVVRGPELRSPFSKQDACLPSDRVRWAETIVEVKLRVDGAPRSQNFQTRLMQLGEHGWFIFQH